MDFLYFKDKELKEPIDDKIEFGKVKAGEIKEMDVYIFNSSVYPYEEMTFSVEHKEVKILSAPNEMLEKTSAKIVLQWHPTVDVKRGLRTSLKTEGYQVVD